MVQESTGTAFGSSIPMEWMAQAESLNVGCLQRPIPKNLNGRLNKFLL